jgi:hypothetical protein
MSTAAASATCALGWSYAVTITIGSPSARISPSFVRVIGRRGSPSGRWSGRGGVDIALLLCLVGAR